MSENTNTPNGVSKQDFYFENEDVGKAVVAITDMAEKDPAKEFTGNVYGDNTETEINKLIETSIIIRDAGSVTVKMNFVGEPYKKSPEAMAEIRVIIEEFKKKKFAEKGVYNYHDYIKMTRDRERGEREEDEEDLDKNNDSIEDRNQ